MDKKRKCYLFLFEGYADWEPALVITGLNNYSNFAISTFSADGKLLRSMGNISVQPDLAIDQVELSASDLLLLPGGELWETGGNNEIIPLIEEAVKRKCTIAAICAATTVLGKMGLLDSINHTSNFLPYLEHHAPAYKGQSRYKQQPVVRDQQIVTANGAAMIDFAYTVFEELQIMPKDELEKWSKLYKSAGMEYVSE